MSVAGWQDDNKKYSQKSSRVNVNNPNFNPAVSVNGVGEMSNIKRNIHKWMDLIAYFRFNPDDFFQLITPETGAIIKLGLDQRMMLRCLARFKSSYCVLPRGNGKCVLGDTLLLTSDGVKEIGSYFNYQNDGIETLKNLEINIVNRYGDEEKTIRGVYSGKKPTIKVTTREGFTLGGTYVHPLLVMNTNGDFEYKQLQDIKVGDYVCIRRGDNIWGHNYDITDAIQQLESWINNLERCQVSHLKIRELPNFMTEDIAYFIGLLLGDGGLSRHNLISFSNVDKDVIERFYRIAQKIFEVTYIRRPNKNDYYIYDTYLRKYFEFIGLNYGYSYDKEIPNCIMTAPKQIVRKTLQGLFDTDGCAESKAVTYSSVSFKMIHQIQVLLLNFGVVASIKPKTDRFGHHSFILSISGTNVDIFNREIGFLCEKKKTRALLLEQKKHNTNVDIIPYQFKYCNDVYNSIRRGERHHFLYHCGKFFACDMTYNRLYQLTNGNYGEYPHKQHFEDLVTLNYFYSKVTNIEYGENDVYDIETIDTHSFVANGFVNHNTMLALMYAFHTCIFYPNVQIALTAQTRENAAKLIKDKYDELLRAFPLLKEEIYNAKFSKDLAEVEFHNGSKIINLANHQSSKGAHVQRGIVDEDNLTDETTYLDVLEPIFSTVPRRTVGKQCLVDPEEMNFSISQLTSSGFRGSSAFYRCMKHLDNMINLRGEMCIGASWELACFYGRGATKAEILKKKDTNTSVSFDMNYRAVWTGNSDSSLVSIARLLSCRTLTNAELKGCENGEYVLGVDVARSDNDNNNQTSISVLKIIRKTNGRVREIQVVNMENITGTLDFEAQSIELKRIQRKYGASVVVIDDNGIGKGIVDACLREQFDPLTGENLGCWDTLNSERVAEMPNSPKIIFCYMAQKYDNKSIPNFIELIETMKLRLLEKKDINAYDNFGEKDATAKLLPFIQTDFLIEEVSNLKLKHLNNGGLSIDRVVKKMNKDRFSSVQYGSWYIMEFMDNVIEETSDDIDELSKYIMW